MSRKPRILAFAGSTRRDSFNKKLVAQAAKVAEQAGAEVTLIDLSDFPMPLFDGDLEKEQGLPEAAVKLKELMIGHDGFLLSCPEYNSSISAVLKNSIDWASRPEAKDEPRLAAFTGKTAALLSASPGALGGLRGLVHVRAILGNIGVHVIPDQLALSQANDAFDDAGRLKDARRQESMEKIGRKLVDITRRLIDD